MKDQFSITAVALLHPKVRGMFTGFITDAETALGITLRVVQGLRTFPEQQAIYEQGRTKPGQIVTKAQAGESYHNYGMAVDIVPLSADGKSLDWNYKFSELESFALPYGITWGGHFSSPDPDHFENKLGHNWRDLLALYKAGKFIEETTYVNI